MASTDGDVIRAWFTSKTLAAAGVKNGMFMGSTAEPSLGCKTPAGVSAWAQMSGQAASFPSLTITGLTDSYLKTDSSGIVEAATGISDAVTYPADGGNNGFVDEDELLISFTDATRTLSIAPGIANFHYRDSGVRYTKSAEETIQIPNTEGIHYIYYLGSTLSSTQTYSDTLFTKHAIIAILYWDATNGESIYFGAEYKHSTNMGNDTHLWAHSAIGFALLSGGGLTDLVVDGNGNDAEDAQCGIELTVATDEDAYFSHSARTSTSNIAVYYRDGLDTSNIWRVDESTPFLALATGAGRAEYNELSAGTWSRTPVSSNGNYLLAHVFTNNDKDRKFGVFMGQNEYSNLNNARDGAETEVENLVVDGLPVVEFKFLGTVILQTSTNYSNTPHARVRPPADGDYVDLRGFVINRTGVSGTVTDHEALANLLGTDNGEHYHSEQITEDHVLVGNAFGGGTGFSSLTYDETSLDVGAKIVQSYTSANEIEHYFNKATAGADDETIYTETFSGKNSVGTKIDYADISVTSYIADTGDEVGDMRFSLIGDGTSSVIATIFGVESGTDGGIDVDGYVNCTNAVASTAFRTSGTLMAVGGVSVGKSIPPTEKLDVVGNVSVTGDVSLSGGTGTFKSTDGSSGISNTGIEAANGTMVFKNGLLVTYTEL